MLGMKSVVYMCVTQILEVMEERSRPSAFRRHGMSKTVRCPAMATHCWDPFWPHVSFAGVGQEVIGKFLEILAPAPNWVTSLGSRYLPSAESPFSPSGLVLITRLGRKGWCVRGQNRVRARVQVNVALHRVQLLRCFILLEPCENWLYQMESFLSQVTKWSTGVTVKKGKHPGHRHLLQELSHRTSQENSLPCL